MSCVSRIKMLALEKCALKMLFWGICLGPEPLLSPKGLSQDIAVARDGRQNLIDSRMISAFIWNAYCPYSSLPITQAGSIKWAGRKFHKSFLSKQALLSKQEEKFNENFLSEQAWFSKQGGISYFDKIHKHFYCLKCNCYKSCKVSEKGNHSAFQKGLLLSRT